MFFVTIALLISVGASAQYKSAPVALEDSSDTITLTLEEALRIALSENVSVKVADKEIERLTYAKKGAYASLFPQVSGSGAYQRTIKKQVMYMDFDMSALGGMGGGQEGGAEGGEGAEGGQEGGESPQPGEPQMPGAGGGSGGGIEVGRWNTWNAGVSASMPVINAQLWKSLQISGQQVELAVEQARSSRLDMVMQVKQAYYSALLAKEAFNVYKEVYENAYQNFLKTERRYNVQKASELEYTRAKATLANAVPNVYNAENSVILALWQLKAVMGVDLDKAIDVAGSLTAYADDLFYDMALEEGVSLESNTTMRQLAIQAEQLANTVKMQKYAYIPTLSLAYSYSMNAMTNNFKFSEYRWTPYSYLGVSVSIPIFSGGKRYHDIRQTKVQAAELDLSRMETERQLRIGIRQYLTTMQTKIKSCNAAGDAVRTAQKAYDISAKSYSVGRSTITDLNDAQLALTQSKLSVSQSVYDFLIAKANLEKILGHDFLDDEGEVDLNNFRQ